MAASRRKKKQRKEKFEKALTAVLCGIVAALVLLAAVISLSEENGGAMPTWQQLYSWFGVAAPRAASAGGSGGRGYKSTFYRRGAGRRCSAGTERRIRTHRTQASGKRRTGWWRTCRPQALQSWTCW